MTNPDDLPESQANGAAWRARQALDTLLYGVAVVVVVVAVSAVVSFPLGGAWVGVKYVLFFVGFLIFGISAFQLRPTPPWKDDEAVEKREATRFERFVERVVPLGRYRLPPDDRLPPAAKLFVASVLMLAVSFVMETVFDVVA